MGRPTENRKDKTVKLRINTELYDAISSLGDNTSETIRDLIKRGLIVLSHKILRGKRVLSHKKHPKITVLYHKTRIILSHKTL